RASFRIAAPDRRRPIGWTDDVNMGSETAHRKRVDPA
ncbi:MAG: hypothetical protein JWR49_726, partial [Tardiphaga sp.]|nr:hypothetical protein [Tardiphaga sp.]